MTKRPFKPLPKQSIADIPKELIKPQKISLSIRIYQLLKKKSMTNRQLMDSLSTGSRNLGYAITELKAKNLIELVKCNHCNIGSIYQLKKK